MKKDEIISFYTRLEAFLLTKGMTINSLEVAVGKESTINKAKKNNKMISPNTVKAIFDYFPELKMDSFSIQKTSINQ